MQGFAWSCPFSEGPLVRRLPTAPGSPWGRTSWIHRVGPGWKVGSETNLDMWCEARPLRSKEGRTKWLCPLSNEAQSLGEMRSWTGKDNQKQTNKQTLNISPGLNGRWSQGWGPPGRVANQIAPVNHAWVCSLKTFMADGVSGFCTESVQETTSLTLTPHRWKSIQVLPRPTDDKEQRCLHESSPTTKGTINPEGREEGERWLISSIKLLEKILCPSSKNHCHLVPLKEQDASNNLSNYFLNLCHTTDSWFCFLGDILTPITGALYSIKSVKIHWTVGELLWNPGIVS